MRYLWAFLALLYLISPRDLLPDALGILGYIDDLIILYFLMRYWIRQAKRQQKAGRQFDERERSQQRPPNDSSTDSSNDPYAILGVSPGATQEEIRQAYRKLASRYHPDKVSHLGQEFAELSEKRFKEIQNAYQILKKDK